MENERKRVRFQLHLSTCFVLMIVASFVAGSNINGIVNPTESAEGAKQYRIVTRWYYEAGWPYWTRKVASGSTGESVTSRTFGIALYGNISFGLAVVLASTIPVEYYNRRQKKGPPSPFQT